MNKKNIVLVGFMGCGKSTIGKKLARLTEYRFIDMDKEIEAQAGMRISEIFEKYGEDCFREKEAMLCEELSESGGCIIATGGGVIKSTKNMELLKKNGTVIYIKASPEHIYHNVKYDNTRPLLAVGDKKRRISELLEERKPLYEERSDITADITGKTAAEAAEVVLNMLKGENVI